MEQVKHGSLMKRQESEMEKPWNRELGVKEHSPLMEEPLTLYALSASEISDVVVQQLEQ